MGSAITGELKKQIMDKKFFVPYETAKLLKEKGYPQELAVWYYYKMFDEFVFVHSRYVPGRVVKGQLTELEVWYTAAPTYHEVLDWLEGKGIRVEVRMGYRQKTEQWLWCGYVYVVEDEDYETSQFADWSSTREEALNDGILKALEML